MTKNERIREALGYEMHRLDEEGGWWWKHPVTGEVDYEDALPDYEHDDAAAVALLEELRRRGHWVRVNAIRDAASERIGAFRYELEYVEGPLEGSFGRDDIGGGDTFREAVVEGALALLEA